MNITMTDVMSFMGMIMGAIGAVTGIIAYRKVTKMKSLDFRLALRNEISDLYHAVRECEWEIELTLGKAKDFYSKIEKLGCSGHVEHQDMVKKNGEIVSSVKDELPNLEEAFHGSNIDELEGNRAEVHRWKNTVDRTYKAHKEKNNFFDKYIYH